MSETKTNTVQEQQQFEQYILGASMFELKPLDIYHLQQYLDQRQAFAKVANETMSENDRNAALNMVFNSNQLIKHLLRLP